MDVPPSQVAAKAREVNTMLSDHGLTVEFIAPRRWEDPDFADGGITALGTNIFLMGIVTVLVGWAVFRGLQMVLPQRVSSVPAAAAGAALVSVPVAALAFVGLYAVGGTVDIPLASLTTAMLSVHALIGLGEAAITFLAVGSIVAVRPDLVYGARRVLATRSLVLRTATK